MAGDADALWVGSAEVADLPVVAAIYGHHVRHSAASFDLEPQPVAHWERVHAALEPALAHHLLVARRGGEVVGWAKSGSFRDRAAYATSVETSVYVAPDAGGRGVGGALYTALFTLLTVGPAHRAYAGITQPNLASVALHLRHGFAHVGTFSEVGRKFDRWWTVSWYERPLSTGTDLALPEAASRLAATAARTEALGSGTLADLPIWTGHGSGSAVVSGM